MANLKYGTAEYYKEQFMDFMADAQADTPEYGNNLIQGFILALDDWLNYHQEQVYEYERLRERVRQALTL